MCQRVKLPIDVLNTTPQGEKKKKRQKPWQVDALAESSLVKKQEVRALPRSSSYKV